APSCLRCCAGSTREAGCCWRWLRSRREGRRNPSPWDEARYNRSSTCSGRARRRWHSCERVPCGERPTGRATFPGRNTSAWLNSLPPHRGQDRFANGRTTWPRRIGRRNARRELFYAPEFRGTYIFCLIFDSTTAVTWRRTCYIPTKRGVRSDYLGWGSIPTRMPTLFWNTPVTSLRSGDHFLQFFHIPLVVSRGIYRCFGDERCLS